MIKFTIEENNKEKEYRLAFDRDSVKYAERKKGLYINDLDKMPVTTYSTLFNVAFYKHHGQISEKVTDEIFAKLDNRDGLMGTLFEEYVAVMTAFIADDTDDENKAKKVSWERA